MVSSALVAKITNCWIKVRIKAARHSLSDSWERWLFTQNLPWKVEKNRSFNSLQSISEMFRVSEVYLWLPKFGSRKSKRRISKQTMWWRPHRRISHKMGDEGTHNTLHHKKWADDPDCQYKRAGWLLGSRRRVLFCHKASANVLGWLWWPLMHQFVPDRRTTDWTMVPIRLGPPGNNRLGTSEMVVQAMLLLFLLFNRQMKILGNDME